MSTRTSATWRERPPRVRPSSNLTASASASRCYLLTSSASAGSVDCDCADRAVPSSNSHSQPSPRTCAARQDWWRDRRQGCSVRCVSLV